MKKLILQIDRSKDFSFEGFQGLVERKYEIADQDTQAITLAEIDFDKVYFENCFKKGESWINGWRKVERHKENEDICLDARVGEILWNEKDQKTLWHLYEERGIEDFELFGTKFRTHYAWMTMWGWVLYFRCHRTLLSNPWWTWESNNIDAMRIDSGGMRGASMCYKR